MEPLELTSDTASYLKHILKLQLGFVGLLKHCWCSDDSKLFTIRAIAKGKKMSVAPAHAWTFFSPGSAEQLSAFLIPKPFWVSPTRHSGVHLSYRKLLMKSVGKALPEACPGGAQPRAFVLHVEHIGDSVWFPFAEWVVAWTSSHPKESSPSCSTGCSGCFSVSDDCSYLFLAFLHLWTN